MHPHQKRKLRKLGDSVRGSFAETRRNLRSTIRGQRRGGPGGFSGDSSRGRRGASDWSDWDDALTGNFGGGFRGGARGRRGGPNVGRHRRSRMFGQGELRLALLYLIAEQTRHGYELIKAIEDLTAGAYAPSPGAVYPTLSLMVDEAVINEVPTDGTRKNFAVAKEGQSELNVRAEEVAALLERLTAHGEDARGPSSPDLFRAMGNLANVLKNRARSGGLGKEVIDQIVDLIDDMAKKIERL